MTRRRDRDRRALELFGELAALPVGPREARLAEACGDDDALRTLIESMLASDEAVDVFDGPHIARGRAQLEAVIDAVSLEQGQPDADEVAPWMPERIGSYELVGLLGRGGMGVVYEAVQDLPHRTVALKLIHPTLVTPQRVRRFEREVEALGRLQHVGIAQIYDAGTVDLGRGLQPWFAMEKIVGVPLDEYAVREGLDVRGRLELIARVCDAVHHAHGKGVVHRDLKSDNVLIDGEGRPKVLDFGVAQTQGAEAETLHTQDGQILGTLGFMAPEQLTGDLENVGPRADVYALGVVAYGLLTGRAPHDLTGLSWTGALKQLLEEEPPLLGRIDRRLAGDVETIVAKALEKEPARRYTSASALAADLRRFLEHRPIAARPATWRYRVVKYTRRHQALVGGAVATGLALLAGTLFSVNFAVEASERATENADLAYRTSLQAAAFGLDAMEPDFARGQLDDVARHHPDRWEVRYLAGRLDPHLADLTAPALDGGDPVGPAPDTELCLLPDGTRIAAALADGTIAAWDARSGALTDRLVEGGPYRSLATTAPRDVLAGATTDGAVALWDLARRGDARLVERFPVAEVSVRAVTWSADGARLAISAGKRLSVREGGALRVLAESTILDGDPEARAAYTEPRFLRDGTQLVVVRHALYPTTELLDVETGAVVLQGPTRQTALAVDPTRDRIAAADAWRHVEILDVADLKPDLELAGHSDTGPMRLAYSPDGALLASASGHSLRTWEPRTGRPVGVLLHGADEGWIGGTPHALALGPAGGFAALATADAVRLWDLRAGGQLVFSESPNYVYHACISPDGNLVAWRDALTGRVFVRDARDGSLLASDFLAPQLAPHAFAHDGSRMLVGLPTRATGADATIWDLAANRLERYPVPFPIEEGFEAAAWSWVASELLGVSTLTVRNEAALDLEAGWYVSNGSPRIPSADSEAFAGSSGAGLIDLESGRGRPLGVGEEFAGVALRPRSDDVAVGQRDGTVRVLDRRDGAIRLDVGGHRGRVFGVAYSPDGTRLATAGEDRCVLIHDAETGELLLTLRGHSGYSFALRWSEDGSRLLSTGGAGEIHLWDAVPRAELQASVARDRALGASLAPRVDALVADCGRAGAADAIRADESLTPNERRVALRRLIDLGVDLGLGAAGDLERLRGAVAVAPDAPGLAPSLALWLSAADLDADTLDHGVVERWPDRSGRGHDARAVETGASPRFAATGLVGRAGVQMGSSTRLELAGDGVLAGGDVTIVAVAEFGHHGFVLRSNREANSPDMDYFLFGVGAQSRLSWCDGRMYTDTHRHRIAQRGSVLGRPAVIAALRVDRAGEAELFFDGERVEALEAGAGGPIVLPASIGPLEGVLGELVVFDRALDDGELEGLERWLAERYGLL